MSSIQRLEVPKWGLSMEEGTVTKWLIAEGDSFSEGDEVCELETSKITNVLEAPFSGTLRKIVANQGETLPVGALMGLCADGSVGDAELEAAAAEGGAPDTGGEPVAPVAASKAEVAVPATAQTAASSGGSTSIPDALLGSTVSDDVVATDHALSYAGDHGIDLGAVDGTGRRERISVSDIQDAIEAAGGVAPPFGRERAESGGFAVENDAIRATPAARKLANESGVSLASLAARSGGRVERKDVEAAIGRGGGGVLADAGGMSAPISQESLTSMRRTIASRLQQSKQQAPHYRVVMEAEIDELLKLRKVINASGARVTVNDFLIKAGANALIAHPDMNVQFDGETVSRFDRADVGVAIAIENGLVSPVLRGADELGLVEISRGVRDLATRAKTGRLKLDEMEGGTFSVSNLGMFGVSQFDAIINPPQVGILAVGQGQKRLIPSPAGPREATIITLSLSSDHRVIDGAIAAQFLGTLKQNLEVPGRMLS